MATHVYKNYEGLLFVARNATSPKQSEPTSEQTPPGFSVLAIALAVLIPVDFVLIVGIVAWKIRIKWYFLLNNLSDVM